MKRGKKMMKIVSTETMSGIIEGKNYDFDRYNFEETSSFSTKETSIVVSFLEGDKEPITGDQIAYGSWYDLELEECLAYLREVKAVDKLRDFSEIIKKIL